MCIKPRPYICTCPSCGWHKTFRPNSDALIPGRDFVSSCPECGQETLTRTEPASTTGMVGQIAQVLGKYFSR